MIAAWLMNVIVKVEISLEDILENIIAYDMLHY